MRHLSRLLLRQLAARSVTCFDPVADTRMIETEKKPVSTKYVAFSHDSALAYGVGLVYFHLNQLTAFDRERQTRLLCRSTPRGRKQDKITNRLRGCAIPHLFFNDAPVARRAA